ncbi:MAG TPA: hypothetical protein VGB08_03495 [Allosphingosinicella sp.]|jgi:hypothetical protein
MLRLPVLVLAFAAAASAAPVAAQIVGRSDYGYVGRSDPFLPDSSLGGPGAGRESRAIRRDIREGRRSGQLSRQEARQLGREAKRIGFSARRYGRDGLSVGESRELQMRVLALRGRVTAARLGRDRPARRGRGG